MEQHFGEWLKRVRNRTGLSQKVFAHALGYKSYAGLKLNEDKPTRDMRGGHTEALLDVVGVADEAALDAMWQAGTLPDEAQTFDRVQARAREYERRAAVVLSINGIRTGAELVGKKAAAKHGDKARAAVQRKKGKRG